MSAAPLLQHNELEIFSGADDPKRPAVDDLAIARGAVGSGGGITHGEDTPAYMVLQKYGLLDTHHRKENFDDIFEPGDLSPNSSHSKNFQKRMTWGVYFLPGLGLAFYNCFNTEVVVPPGCICCFVDSDNNYIFAKPGVHNINDPFLEQAGNPIALRGNVRLAGGRPGAILDRQDPLVEHGNRTIVTVPQGKLGYATDRGQPVLLPPGLHSWKSDTLKYERTYELDKHVIEIGPYTILTVDEGYSAITQNNGLQVVLEGGKTHLLTHQKWRFEKFITLKIQTDDLESIEAASADNVIMSVDSTVVWKIKDVQIAATMAAETMASAGQGEISADITKLRRDVLKQAIASLAGFIGSVNYSDSFNVAAAAQRNMETAEAIPIGEGATCPDGRASADNPMFDTQGMSEAVAHANNITSKFGVEILSINIISANPVDDKLTQSLATGAVASAEALQAETQARGMAKAMKIEAEAKAITTKINAESEAMATIVKAKADGEAEMVRAEGAKAAEILRAEGSKQAAELIQSSQVAITLETMKTSASAIKNSDKFFFGQEPSYMSNIVMKGPESIAVTEE
eukprot:CAMPEP_0183293972 /NCGR_PEP_ID=MMETSP0160_2-20130417/2474_1 /TAXON_ID=2839 ORGANISM="Odontella Sinensis, Strain Grunow 1884" /NCGR_SAMPLE_ID=MMETSP0160_2 /ASSEMBLY_ACC=CAM_ASM_000250 /LENGTH=571 /DNA_ID=CAMNT_0025455193 /DNA_START=126 /DNA_END=1841 /DNA_ORIENTATION=-